MDVKLLAITPDAQGLIERAGRVCHRSKPSDELNTMEFIQKLIKCGHLSVLEHASATFEISNVSRSYSHQNVRHRIASYSQESMRYVDVSDNAFIVPETIVNNEKALFTWLKITPLLKNAYEYFLELDIPKEDARFILPIATGTKIISTMNFSNWRHFITVRNSEKAQWEIRGVAGKILDILYYEAPYVFADLYRKHDE